MELERWQLLMQDFSIGRNEKVYFSLSKAYQEKHRHYHTDAHIDACLRHFDEVKYLAESPFQIEMALWFHDAVYKPFAKDNERQSADWCSDFLTQNEVDNATIQNIETLIMATLHHAIPENNDTQLLVDIDLSILGTSRKTYQEFEQQVRKEYRWIPYFYYRKKRIAILQSFLERQRIYQSDFFYQKLESQARENLSAAIQLL